jgi:hypothetical protein
MDAHPANIEAEIRRLSDQAEPLVTKLARQSREAGEAEAEYRVAYATAFLNADGPMAMREQIARLASAKELLRRNITAALADTTKEAGRMLRSQLDALRSINANARQAAGL